MKGAITAAVLLIITVSGAALPARAACVSPAEAEGTVLYNEDFKVFQYCNGTDWIAMHAPGSGTGGCTGPDRPEGKLAYNAGHRVMQGCAGNIWQAMGPVGGSPATASWDSPARGPVLENPDPTAGDYFGFSVAVDGTTAVVGTYDNPGGISGAGTAYVFDTAAGALVATLDNPDPTPDDWFGYSVAVDGTTAVVGAIFDDPGGVLDAGAAYVFDTASGALIATLDNPDPTENDVFGISVAVSGTTAVIGAYGDDPGGVNGAGTAYVFDTASGALLATLNNPDPTPGDFFGNSVAVSGTTAVVGAPYDDPGGVGDAGTAYVFDTASGVLLVTLNNPDPTGVDYFGNSVAVDGNTAVAGAHFDTPGGISRAGTAYVFDTVSGALAATLNNPDPTAGDWFGYSVAVDGTTAVVGASYDDPAGVGDAGTAYVFDTASGGLIATLNNPDPTAGDFFGNSVAVSGVTTVIGVPLKAPGGISDAGTAYTFTPGLPGACIDPARPEGTLFYNSDFKVMQYCDGAGWIEIGEATPAVPPAGPAGCPTIGDLCSDGSYYIGQLGGNDIYATAAASETSQSWNNGTTNWTVTGFTSTTDGLSNTAGLTALADAGAPYNAAAHCDGLAAHGHSDWYLPAQDELDLFWNGGAPVAGVLTDGSWYWSSTESGTLHARIQRFSLGHQNGSLKDSMRPIRCVRRGTAAPSSP